MPEPVLSVVVPLYNEQANFPELHRRLMAAIDALAIDHELIFVNDGSRDDTPRLLNERQAVDPHLVILHLSRNFGHQAAVSAGLDAAHGRAVLVMDGDLQDPPEVIPDFLAMWRQGYDVVYAVRQARKEGWFKKLGYKVFYRLLNSISDLEIPLDSGDFGLMDRRVVEAVKTLPERKRFVRGLRTFVGFRQVGLAYERAAREAGSPKYTIRGLINLAVDGLVSFSSYPLRLVTYLGLITIAIGLILTLWVFIDALTNGTSPRGWASTIVIVLFMGAVQLISLGIVGEYVRLIFLETKGRPTYIVAERRGGEAGSAASANAEPDAAAPKDDR